MLASIALVAFKCSSVTSAHGVLIIIQLSAYDPDKADIGFEKFANMNQPPITTCGSHLVEGVHVPGIC